MPAEAKNGSRRWPVAGQSLGVLRVASPFLFIIIVARRVNVLSNPEVAASYY